MAHKLNWNSIQEGLGETLAEELEGVLEAGKEDLKKFGKDIAQDLIEAVRSGDQEWKAQLQDQLKLIAEANRIRLNEASWSTALKIIRAAAKGIGLGIAGALPL